MRRKATFPAALALAASLGLTGCAGVVESSYDAVGEGARQVFSVTLSVSAGLANWVGETLDEEVPPCPQAPPTA